MYYKNGNITRPKLPISNPTEAQILEAGYKKYSTERPAYDPDTHKLVKGELVKTETEAVQKYDVVELTFEELLSRLSERFIVTQKQISTDGVETAVCKYFTDSPVTFFVDDGEITPITVEPVDYWAVLEISATSAGRIDVFIENFQTSIFAL